VLKFSSNFNLSLHLEFRKTSLLGSCIWSQVIVYNG
jgi:hypothetical protein